MPLFPLGHIVGTPGALRAMDAADVCPAEYLNKHSNGDWGEVPEEDKQANNAAILDCGRLLSSYILPKTGVKIWCITEGDRSATTFLLPDEY